jgi:acetyl-CoA synthetase
MRKLTEYSTYADAQRHFSGDALWALFDGDRDRLNIIHECIDRWAGDPSRVAYADGSDESLTFASLPAWGLRNEGVRPGDCVAIMLEPSLPFYAILFGTMKFGAVAVPLFTLFGPDGVRLRVDDCAPSIKIRRHDPEGDARNQDDELSVLGTGIVELPTS